MHPLVVFCQVFCIAGFGVCIIGFILYKSGVFETSSWEETISVMLKKCITVFYEESTGKTSPQKVVNTSLYLVNEDITQLLKMLDNTPYIVPTLANCTHSNGVLWVDIRAVKLATKYEDLEQQQLSQMVFHIIQNFYMQTRGFSVRLFIRIATTTRCYFAIPLSEEGYQFLEKQQASVESGQHIPNATVSLEEEIPLFEEINGDTPK